MSRASLLLFIFGFTVLFMLVLLFLLGLLTSDTDSYFWYSRIWMEHGASPFTHVPLEFSSSDPDGSIYWVYWQKVPSVYGPAWAFISGLSYNFGQILGGSFSAHLLSVRLLADVAHLINGFLVWSVAGLLLSSRRARKVHATRLDPRLHTLTPALTARAYHYAGRMRHHARLTSTHTHRAPSRLGLQTAALLFYLWNPLMLTEFAGGGHNDVVMLTFVLACIFFYLKGFWRLAACALAIGVLVKVAALIFVLGFIWLPIWKRVGRDNPRPVSRPLIAGAWRATQAAILMLALFVVFYIPFWEGFRTLQPLVDGPASSLYLHTLAADIVNNVPDLAAKALRTTPGHVEFVLALRQFLQANLELIFMALFALLAMSGPWRARTINRALTTWGWLAIAVIMAQGWFWPWYVCWPVTLAALAPSRRLRNTAIIFSVSSLLIYPTDLVLGPYFHFFLDWSGFVTMGPPLVYLLASWLLHYVRARRPSVAPASMAEQPTSQARQRPELAR